MISMAWPGRARSRQAPCLKGTSHALSVAVLRAGDVYLANPQVLAASLVLGWIAGPEDLPPAA